MSLSERLATVNSKADLGKLAELLERSGIDIEDIGRIDKVNVWQGFLKDADGNPQLVDMAGITLSPAWDNDPEWPVVQAAKPVIAKPRSAPKSTPGDVIFIAPDPQIGCRRYEDGTLDWFQDDRAIDLSLQIIRDLKPTKIVNLGDTLDLAEWSDRWAIAPEMVLTTQPTLDRAHRFLAEQITEAPDGCEVILMEGNHDARLGKLIQKNAMAALRLRQANAPESWPVLSVQHLLRLDEFPTPVTYVDGYPAGRIKLTAGSDNITPLYAIHGERLSVSAVTKAERQSYVQGHMHHIADFWSSYELDGELINVNSWSPGCLCRVDGAVPSVKGGTKINGKPVARQEQWQQGVGVVTVMPDGSWGKEIVPIFNGRAIFRGKEYLA